MMAEGKIQFQLGRLTFSGEGSEAWLTKQLEYIISKVPELAAMPQMQEPENLSEDKPAAKKTV